MAGMMAMSAAPWRSASAHKDGTVKERSYLPRSEPFVKPHTNGAVFRYCTIEMRSLGKFAVLSRQVQYSRPDFGQSKDAFAGLCWGTFPLFQKRQIPRH